MTLVEHYQELLSLAQLYLQQEHNKEEWIIADRQHFQYFKDTAQKQQPTKPASAPVPAKPLISSNFTPQPKPAVAAPVIIEQAKPVEKPKPAIKPVVEEKKAPAVPGYFVPEHMTRTAPVDFTDIRQIVADKYPALSIIDDIPQPPSQEMADVLIINTSDDPTHLDFLQKVAKAIKDRFCSAEVCSISQFSNWEKIISSPNLKLILMVGMELDNHPELKQYYRELPKHNRQLLSKVPFIPMAEIPVYLADVKQKSLLWKSVCEHLQT